MRRNSTTVKLCSH